MVAGSSPGPITREEARWAVDGFLRSFWLCARRRELSRAQASRGQPWSSHLVVPQARSYAPAHSPALQITGVTAGVVIRDRIATTMMEIHVRNPSAMRQEAELLVPVPDGAVVREFAFQGSGAEPSARLLSRDEAREIYDRIVTQARDPALLEFAGLNLVRSSCLSGRAGQDAGGPSDVRTTADGERRSG